MRKILLKRERNERESGGKRNDGRDILVMMMIINNGNLIFIIIIAINETGNEDELQFEEGLQREGTSLKEG